MLPIETIYPQFEANQVLSQSHLNDLFEYLDEQNRLTRTNLIGIGIVCGLDVETAADGTQLTITRGCGITSEGYLVVMEELIATHRQDYFVPEEVKEVNYPVLYDNTTQQNKYDLWELTDTPTNGSIALDTDFLADKIVMIFVELLLNQLRNCSPNSCDDKGAEVNVAFRPLLILKDDADEILENVAALPGAGNSTDIGNLINASLALPEMRIPRVSVPYSHLVTTQNLIDAYRDILSKDFIENTVRKNLLAAFDAFHIFLTDLNRNLIINWVANYGGDNRVLFDEPYQYQYYYDFISDLIEAYHEIRLKGIEILSLCCPNPQLFPRHLFLKEAKHSAVHERKYRHYFIPSPILGKNKDLSAVLYSLFERLISQIQQVQIPLTITPSDVNKIDPSIKITPSMLGNFSLSDKSIPYYYDVLGGPPELYQLWNYYKTSANKANHNLSYHANRYPGPTAEFVRHPLRYDLEPYNFLRIEGHVGKPIRTVINTLTHLKRLERLPFEFVALKTGNVPVSSIDERSYRCYYQDLEAIYGTAREELRCLLCQNLRYFYDLGDKNNNSSKTKIQELLNCDPNFSYNENTLGAVFEEVYEDLKANRSPGFSNLEVNDTDSNALYFMFYMVELKSTLEDRLSEFIAKDFDSFSRYYRNIQSINRTLRDNNTDGNFIGIEDFTYHIDSVLQACKKEAFEALIAEYNRRIVQIQEQLLLGSYTRQHPGINHKGGVPVGGTFLIVYHGSEEKKPDIEPHEGDFTITGSVQAEGEILPGVKILVEGTTIGTVTDIDGKFRIEVTRIPIRLQASFIGYQTSFMWVTKPNQEVKFELLPDSVARDSLAEGMVIADFYLPYLCCSDCPPVQFVLPEEKSEEPCDLPCNGKFVTCRYVPWLFRPKPETEISYDVEMGSAGLIIKDESGTEIFNEDIAQIIQDQIVNSLPINYDDINNKINDRVSTKLQDDKSFYFGYDSNEGVLQIAHYACYTFEFKVEFKLSLSLNQEFKYTYLFTDKNLTILNNQTGEEQTIDEFGCMQEDKCQHTPPEGKELSENEYKLEYDTGRDSVHIKLEPSEPQVKTFWIMDFAKPSLKADDMDVQIELLEEFSPIRVVVIEEDGSWKYVEEMVKRRQQ